MKYRIKSSLKQEVLSLLLERRATTVPRIKKIVLTDKEMFLPKWLKYFSLEELDYYLEPVTEYGEAIIEPIHKKVSENCEEKEETKSVDKDIIEEEPTQEKLEEYYGI